MTVDRQITVLVPTSPIHSHPDASVIEETVGSIRDRLPSAEILLMCDGPHPSLDTDRVNAYREYLQRVAWKAQHEWGPCLPIIHDSHQHQVRMTRHALGLVRTPLVLFVEHDCPLAGEVDWQSCADAILSGAVNVTRFYHETVLQPEHAHLMLGPVESVSVPLVRTVQYSQRPHLASSGFYRWMMDADWWPEHAGMVEDVCHSRVEVDWREHGESGWQQWRLSVYMPDGNVQRSTHLDGRGPDDKVIVQG